MKEANIMPDATNAATKTPLGDDGFVIAHPDGSANVVINTGEVHYHSNSGAFDEHGAHFNDQARLTDEEGIAVHNNSVSNLDANANYQHLGDHSRSSYEDGTTFQTHLNSNEQVQNYVSIIQLPGEGAEVSHANVHLGDYF